MPNGRPYDADGGIFQDMAYLLIKKDNTVLFRVISVHSSRPNSQFTETPSISAIALSSISDTGRFCPSSKDNAGVLISIPLSWSLVSNSICFIPWDFRASVTLAPIIFLLPSSSFLGLMLLTPFNSYYMFKEA